MNAQQQRPLKVNLGAVKRLIKDKKSYEQEVQEAQDKIQQSQYEQGSSEMKHLIEIRQEAEQMVHDVERRLNDFKAKLGAALKDVENDFPDDPLVIEAKSLLN